MPDHKKSSKDKDIDYLHPDGKPKTVANTELEKKNEQEAKESTELAESLSAEQPRAK
jgi:hypothetical protein